MPWINLTIRKGALPKETQHAVMGKLTEVLMWWEKVPNTPRARSIMKGWVYEVAEDADYIALRKFRNIDTLGRALIVPGRLGRAPAGENPAMSAAR